MKPLFLSICLAIGLANAATLPYQGLATDGKGNPKADASYRVDFALYSSQNGITPLWSESQKLATHKGLFSASLGVETAIPDSLLKGTALYLGVSFDGGSEGGRVLLGTTVWAKTADTAKVALHVIGADSVALRNVRDSVSALTSKVKSDSSALAKTVTDSTKALRDTVSNLKTTISNLNITVSHQAASITNQANSLTSLMSILNSSVSWQTGITYGTLLDSRDGQVYRTVVIGTQTWMAQNLNYAGLSNDTGKCYNSSVDSCTKNGRLYTWAEVMKGTSSSAASPSGVKGICPTGWHVPSDAEWTKLTDTSLTASTAGIQLKSTSGWNTNTGTDIYGFRALPGGSFDGFSFNGGSAYGYWWSAAEYDDSSYAWSRYWGYGRAYVLRSYDRKAYGFSLRCSKD
jgi:uncharacterized protein (TIGR02145 family)